MIVVSFTAPPGLPERSSWFDKPPPRARMRVKDRSGGLAFVSRTSSPLTLSTLLSPPSQQQKFSSTGGDSAAPWTISRPRVHRAATAAHGTQFSVLARRSVSGSGAGNRRQFRRGARAAAAAEREAVKPGIASKYSLIASGSNLPHPDKMEKGGEDAWFVKAKERGGGALAVADGVGGYSEMGVDPGLYASVLAYEAFLAAARDTAELPLDAADAVNAGAPATALAEGPQAVIAAAQREAKLPGAATLCVVDVQGTELRAANVGDSGFRVIRGNDVIFGSEAQQHWFNCPYQLAYQGLSNSTDTAEDAEVYVFPVQPGDIVVAGSDGLFDNVFDEDIAQVVTATMEKGSSPLSATHMTAEALVQFARSKAADLNYESPFALERTREMELNGPDQGGGLSRFRFPWGAPEPEKYVGGKMDDITVVVGQVVETADATSELKEAVTASEQLAEMMLSERMKGKIEEDRTARQIEVREQLERAWTEKQAKEQAEEQRAVEAKEAPPPEFTSEEIAAMDKTTVRKLLMDRGLPTAGKIERLKERLAQVKKA